MAAKRGRKPRAQQSFDKENIHDDTHDYGSAILLEDDGPLPNIPPRAGYAQRWVRVETKEGSDARNLARMAARGWKPRQASTVSKALQWLTVQNETHGGVIGTHDCILMERHEEIQERAEKTLKQRRRDLGNAAKSNLFREHDNFGGASAGISPDYESTSSVERGRRPNVADD